MSRLQWDAVGERTYETGVSQGVLYPRSAAGLYPLGVAWNGLVTVTENPSGAESNPKYADNIKYLNLLSAEEFGCTIEAYTYPDEFAICDGSAAIVTGVMIGQQSRTVFGLCYKTAFGNDAEGNDYGYKLHIVYGGQASPSEKGYQTINESPDAITFSWDITTTPVTVTGFKPTATLVIDSTKVDAAKLAILENILYGSVGADPRLPLIDEIVDIFTEAAPSALALSSIVPAHASTNVAVDTTVVMTFNNQILEENVNVILDSGGVVVGSKSWDSTKKILTFTPIEDLDNDSVYLVIISGVVDIYNQELTTVVKDFSTVSI